MNFGELKSESRLILWPEGEQENLIPAHNRFFSAALWDLQKNVECFQFNNTNVYPHCSTYFNCGMTVLPAPKGKILRIYTIKKNATATPTAITYEEMESLIPVMTSNTAPNGVASASYNNQQAFRPFDGSTGNTWNSGHLPAWIQYKFDTPTIIDQYSSYQGPLFTFEKDWTFSGSNDGVNFTVLDTRVGYSEQSPGSNVFNFTNTTPYLYYRWTITKANGVSPGQETWFNTISGIKMARKSAVVPTGSEYDWCLKVEYHQVDFCHIENYVRLARTCRDAESNSVVAAALAFNIFGCGWKSKYRYNCPTDEGFESLPTLPQGFHYPQSSTDAGGRSPAGVWALYRGRIYIAPWIESDEVVVVEWNGIKNAWSDDDLIEDGEKFREAVRLYVNIQHFTSYEQNPLKLQELKDQYYGIPGRPGVLQDLIHECREQIRERTCNELGTRGAGASGMGATGEATALYYNESQSYTANCPTGRIGSPVTVTIAAGQISSSLSVADANARALARAQADATSRLSCSDEPTTYYNIEVSYTATCPAADGSTPAATGTPVTITIPAGRYASQSSQADANAAALAAARSAAEDQLSCTYWNSPQSYTAKCPTGTTGSEVTKTVPAGTYPSDDSQAAADELAMNAAQNEANAELVCTGITYIIGNDRQSSTKVATLSCPGRLSQPFNYTAVVEANTITATVTAATEASEKARLNSQALSAAIGAAERVYQLTLQNFLRFC